MCKYCCDSGGGPSRRELLLAAAGAAAIGGCFHGGLMTGATKEESFAPVPAGEKPVVYAAFLRPKADYWLGWPGTAWDKKACPDFIAGSRKRVDRFGAELGVKVVWENEPLYDDAAVNAFIAKVKADKPQGVLAFPLQFDRWAAVKQIAQAGVPTIAFGLLGVCFTGHIAEISRMPGVFLASSPDVELAPVRFGLKMIRANYDIRRTRVAVLVGNETKEQTLEPLGLQIRYVPRNRFPEVFKTIEVTPDVKAMVREYRRAAAKIVEPNDDDLLNAAKNYYCAKKIMQDEGCSAISMECLGLVMERLVPTPPCLAWSRFLDAGISATCEADLNGVMSHELSLKLLGKAGFMQDPVPNTFDNTFIGAHCVCPTKLHGPDGPREKFILRSHAESDIGVSVQVIWPVGAEVTVMQFVGPSKMILGRGKVVRNLDTPPAGGCRTSVELALDGPPDTRDTKGFHQLFIAGKHVRDFQAYAQMYGIATEHI